MASQNPSSKSGAEISEEDNIRQVPSSEERSLNDDKSPIPATKIVVASKPLKKWGSISLLLASAVAPLAVLLWWIVRTAQLRPSMLNGTIVGGRLSYIQAKAIDFICGALLAPLIMLLLDEVWFAKARTAAVNERQSHGLPLSSMVVVSNTSQGGFSLLKIRALTQGKTWKLFSLALLVLLSGFSSKMLSNLIGYEAFNVDEPDKQPATLRLMLNRPSVVEGLQFTNYSTSQQSTLANQMTALLTGLNFESAVNKLDADGGYIGTNATAASMDALDPSIVGLTNVPGYRLSIDCQPAQPDEFSAVQMGETSWKFEVIFGSPNSFETPYSSEIPGIMGIGSETADNDEYTYVAFENDDLNVYLGVLDSFNYTQTSPSIYGNVLPSVFNMTTSNFQGTKSIMTTWGINCSIQRQEGLLNYSRQPGQSWTISNSSFSSQRNISKSYLSDWQINLNYQAPISTMPGLGAALSNTAGGIIDGQSALESPFNWTTYALNYLYASGETQRISFEVANSNSSSDPSDFYTVGTIVSVQHYRIVYIPLLLLLGMLGVLGAAAVTSFMMFLSRDRIFSQIGLEFDTLRLVVDSAVGLASETPVLADAAELDKSDLKRWAEKFQVEYYETPEDGQVVIRLARL